MAEQKKYKESMKSLLLEEKCNESILSVTYFLPKDNKEILKGYTIC